MNMTISVSNDDEQRLLKRAADEGKNVETVVLDAIHEKLTPGNMIPQDGARRFGPDEWMRRMNEWISNEAPAASPAVAERAGIVPRWDEWALYSTRMA